MNTAVLQRFVNAFIRCRRSLCTRWIFAGFVLFLFFLPYHAESQNEPVIDEISVFLQVKDVGGIEIPAVIQENVVYLPIKEIFEFLKFKTDMSQSMDSISGFFVTTKEPYLVDYKNNRILFQGNQFPLKKGDLIRTETNIYLLSSYFGEIFGLNSKFSVRTLSVSMETKLELPSMREKRLEQMRQNISKVTGDVRADTLIKRNYPFFHFGMADWSVIATQQIGQKEDTRINLALGSVIAGGEANLMLNFNTNEAFTEKQQYYYLKYVNNSRAWLRQIILGKIATDAISSIYNPVVGLRLTNTPTTYRRSFGTYNLSDYTNPNWMVELYVNNVLVDYVKADASGFFTFQVPLVYGNSFIKLKFYGPWGEEHFKEQTLTIPFSFMPTKKLEYTFGAGLVEDGKGTIFSRVNINYGLSKSITIGGGVEYLSSVSTGTSMPFFTVATRPVSNLILSGEYTYGVRAKGILNYQLLKNIQMELNYTKYEPGQKAVNFNYLEERKAIITLPFKTKKLSIYNRLTYNQIIMPGTRYTTTEWLISGSFLGVNTNLTNYAMFSEQSKPYTYSNLSMSLRLPKGYMFIPQTQYNYSQGIFISAKLAVEKYVFKNGFFTLSYENNFLSSSQMAQFGFRYDLPYAQTGFTLRQSNTETTLMEVARGSLIVDAKSKYFGTNNRISVGKGGLVFSPFLDMNCNNRRDPGEPKEYDLNIRISGGKPFQDDRDSTIRVLDLEPYTAYFVELDQNSFDNVAWKLRKKTMSVVVDPNQFKMIDIPIAVVGEVSGTVNKKGKGEDTGIGRIVVNIFNLESKIVAKTLTEQDGYFSYLGLAPGKYYAQVDTLQLKRVHMVSEPDTLHFSIKPSRDGDIVDGRNFTLTSLLKEEELIQPEKPAVAIATPDKSKETAIQAEKTTALAGKPVADTAIKTPPSTQTTKTTADQNAIAKQAPGKAIGIPVVIGTFDPNFTYLQVGAFKNKTNADNLAQSLSKISQCPVVAITDGGFYKVRLGGFDSESALLACKNVIITNGYFKENQIFIVSAAKIAKTSTTIVIKTVAPVTQKKDTTSVAKPIVSKPDTTRVVKPVIRKPDTTQKATTAKVIAPPAAKPQISKKQYFVQVGAFIDQKNATRVAQYLTHAVPFKLQVVFSNRYYKVRFGAFNSLQEAEDCIQLMEKKGIENKETIVIEYDAIGIQATANQKTGTSVNGLSVQIGSFVDKENAKNCSEKMASIAPYPITIVEEKGRFIVKFGPFKTMTESQDCQKILQNKGISYFIRF
ncbi:MAG: SPOR domain-containing protein [Bacteroidia bacterium]|nr:SPOR domain-containing protein [Bacteroidia bacterium]